MHDLRIIEPNSGKVVFDVYGKDADTGLGILQRLYTVLLATNENSYRNNDSYSLLNFIEGGNIPDASSMNSLLSLCSSEAIGALDESDRDKIESFTASFVDGSIQCSLKLTDGTAVKGVLQ